ncbi:MAG: histidine--tRNA ligase [Candidatus Nanoarchaeia archaeon]|nr:histidine--tRNA ligase [Candidatus Nanoarchaeia archaeon]
MKPQLAKGTRDIMPEEQILRQKIMSILRKNFELYGYSPLETPILERYETLAAKFGAGQESDALKETFKLKDQGDRDLGLRFDLTVPLARFIALNPQVRFPFKRYQIGRVFRDGPIKLGRYREFWQCDIDVIGTKNLVYDAELLKIVDEIFSELNFEIEIQLNSRNLLKDLLGYFGIKNDQDSVIITLDKIEKLPEQEVENELKEKGIKKAKELIVLLRKEKDNKKTLAKIKKYAKPETLNEINTVLDYLTKFKVGSVVLNPGLARGLSYYTGPVFEVFLKNSEIKSSVCGGGRYDNMIGNFMESEQEIPATGISFGMDVILDAIKSRGDSEIKTPVTVYLIPIKNMNECIPILQKLRDNNINSEMDYNEKNISKNLDYANKLSIPYVLICGPRELEENKLKLKNMISGEEKLLSLNEIIKLLKNINQN